MKTLQQDWRVGWVLLAFAASQLVAMGWDLPGSYGWENDGIAPRDFFAGIGMNLTPGESHRYPLFHNLLLGVLSLPVLLPAALAADEWSLPALMKTVLDVPTMTGVSIIAKLLGLVMACVSILVLAKMARRTVSPQAGLWAAVWAATSLSFAYYGRVSNLDGPYLTWTALAMDRLLTVAEHRRRRDYVLFGVLAGAAVATKDQAYASFVGPGIVYLVLLPLREDRPFGPRRTHYRNTVLAAASGALSLGLLGGGLLNPLGFVARFTELTGAASHDWMRYERSLTGVTQNVVDIFVAQEPCFWPWPVVALCWLGAAIALLTRGADGIRARAFRLLPLCAGLSSLLFFTLVVARSEHRFVLPFGFWLSYYGGVAVAALSSRARDAAPPVGRLANVGLAGLVAWSALHSLQAHLTQRGDARNQVTVYLDALPRGTVVETYHLLVHLPHFDMSDASPYRVQRVSRRPIDQRNPLVGAREIDAPYGNVHRRDPDVLVVPEYTALEFVPPPLRPGEAAPAVHADKVADQDAQSFFGAVLDDSLEGYALVHVAEPTLPAWARALGLQPVQVHASVGNRQLILRRTAP